MKKFTVRTAVALATVASVGLLAPVSAFASGSEPATTSTTTSTTIPLRTHPHTLAAYRADRMQINQAFKWAIASAQSIYQQARSQANTAAARGTARTAFELALIQAAAARDSELTALGGPPSH